jgi:protein dithiol oxidoreductase (disulfide-forming)
MTRWLTLALLLALSACARHSAPAAPPPTAPASAAAPAPAEPAAARSSPAQSEIEQATASQESGGSDADRDSRSDASLEQLAGAGGGNLPAGKWRAGVNYEPLAPAQPTSVGSGKVEVLEVFWLACPHCYALEPYLRTWLKSKPGYIEFVRVPVIWQPIHRAHARLYYTLEALGRDDLVEKAFETLHAKLEQGQPPLVGDSDADTLRAQQQFALANGIAADDFANAYNSFAVNADLQRAEEITQRYQVLSVPFIAVNGRYTTDIGKAGGEAKLIDLINDLAASERGH